MQIIGRDDAGYRRPFECEPTDSETVTEALKRCVNEKVHEASCTPSADDNCIKNEYRECGGDTQTYENCDGTPYSMDTRLVDYVVPEEQDYAASPKNPDYVIETINVKPFVNKDGTEEEKPVTVCKNSWLKSFLNSDIEKAAEPCLTVTYDLDSMRGYSKSGFGENFCYENKGQFVDSIKSGCFWGGVGVGLIFAAPSGGTSLELVVGAESGAVLCEKLADMEGNWPNSQYE